MDKYEILKDIINNAHNIVLFTGAGISVPSGIPDFRSADGIYNSSLHHTFRPEEVISHSFFVKYPEYFYEFYKSKMVYPKALPNEAHIYFAKLEEEGKLKAVVTQNIDGLHSKAGSKKVLELHGSVLRNHCMKCNRFYDDKYVSACEGIPYCSCGGIVKPDVVLYEESLPYGVLEESVDIIRKADVLIVVGTSLVVQPAASLITYFRGDKLVLINKSHTMYDDYADLVINEDVVEVVRKIK